MDGCNCVCHYIVGNFLWDTHPSLPRAESQATGKAVEAVSEQHRAIVLTPTMKRKPQACNAEILGPLMLCDCQRQDIRVSPKKYRHVIPTAWTPAIHCSLPKGHKGPHGALNRAR